MLTLHVNTSTTRIPVYYATNEATVEKLFYIKAMYCNLFHVQECQHYVLFMSQTTGSLEATTATERQKNNIRIGKTNAGAF